MKSRLLLAAAVVGLYWAFHSGRLIWTGSGIHLASYSAPGEAPTAEVHPEVLNLQASFSKVAELVKPAVVNISTVRVEQLQQAPQFFFGDPLEQFFDQFSDPYNSMNPSTPVSPQKMLY